tara:strand:+ start:730 stop:1026 length:297 start_codon:yes stop_codon:yes gene_type:complete
MNRSLSEKSQHKQWILQQIESDPDFRKEISEYLTKYNSKFSTLNKENKNKLIDTEMKRRRVPYGGKKTRKSRKSKKIRKTKRSLKRQHKSKKIRSKKY